MKTAMNASLLTLLLLIASGCPFVSKQYITDEPITQADGTIIPAGTPIYEDENGEPTTTVTEKPWLEADIEKLESLNNMAGKATSGLPFGIGHILSAIGGAALGALGASRLKKRVEVNDKLAKKPKTV